MSWRTPDPPDQYERRPQEFAHHCWLPSIKGLAVRPGMTFDCRECGCPWVIGSRFQHTGDVMVAVDQNRPWEGVRHETQTRWYDKPHWTFDWSRWHHTD